MALTKVNSTLVDGAINTDSSGNVGIGTSSPGAKLAVTEVGGSGTQVLITSAAGTNIRYDTGRNFANNRNWLVGCDWLNEGQFAIIPSTVLGGGTFSTAGIAIDGSSGNFRFNSGYGSAAIAYGCRAWVNFNGTGTVAIIGSGNVSSISDINTGLYRVNFTTAMPDANYGVVYGFCMDNASSGVGYYYGTHTVNGVVQDKSASAVQTLCKSQTGNDADSRNLSVSVFR